MNPYYIVTHYSNYAEVTKHYYNGTARLAAALEADNDLSDIETSPTSIGVKTNLLNLLNMVGAQEGVDYQQQSLYGEELQTYAQAVMSLEDYTTLINDNLEEDPGTPPEGQDRCTFSRYWPYEIHNLDCDPVIYFYHPDYLGHTEYITDRNGDAYQYFHYSAFGETLIEEHSGQGTHTDYFRFNGKELDPETGNYYYGARYYDPKVSVWLSVDPKAYAFPSVTPYSFMMNNPMNVIDPGGDSAWTVNIETGERTYVDDRGGAEQQIVSFINNKGHDLGKQVIEGGDFYYGRARDGYFASKYDLWVDIPNGHNALSGYEYNSKDLMMRYWVLNDPRSYRGFKIALRNSESSGKAEPVSAEAFWSYFGQTVGQYYLGKLYLNSAFDMEGKHGSAGAGKSLRAPRGYNPTQSAPAPRRYDNFPDFLESRKGKDIGKYPGRGNWMRAQRDLYFKQKR